MQNTNLVKYLQETHTVLLTQDRKERKASLLNQVDSERQTVGLVFAGQGFDYISEIQSLYAESEAVQQWIEESHSVLVQWIQTPEILAKGLFPLGLHILDWIQTGRSIPSDYLERVSVSHPLIFIAQVARYIQSMDRGLSALNHTDAISFTTGYSQGMIPALFCAEMVGVEFSLSRALKYLEYTFWQGILMESQWLRLNQPEIADFSSMASVSGIDKETLSSVVEKIQQQLDEGERVKIAIQASRTRFVVSGPGQALEKLFLLLSKMKEHQKKQKKVGQFGGKVLNFTWESIPVAAAFHNEMLIGGIDVLRAKCQEIGFDIQASDLAVPVFRYDETTLVNDCSSVLEYLMHCQFVYSVEWFTLMSHISNEQKVDVLLDFGPGDGLTRLSYSSVRGSGIELIPLCTENGQERLFTIGSLSTNRLVYTDFMPSVISGVNGERIDNLFTQSTGCPPIILPGMTPTTADVDIVAAAANNGYVAELAGGGQVNESIFWTRMEELKEKLDPGQGVVFNALFLDRYLWNLHFGKHNLVLKARQAGYPICGVTISAGIPEVDEAVELFTNFQRNGIWLNALKAGNGAQVKQVIQIANALPDQTIYLHLEGGKAGGHHSWEDLEQLLLESYHLIRSTSNLVLCVGGGIATEERAAELLNGTWSKVYGLLPMPVDSVLLGTICMAVKEAKTSRQVKEALVSTSGTPKWVYSGSTDGGMTSGKSQLNADIHYVDNFAAQCGRLLDSVAGDAEKVAEKYDEIVSLINKTAKPFFGEIEEMTYAQLLTRMLTLMAVGQHDPYEDGRWPDPSFRNRFAEMLWRSESRLHPQQEGAFTSILDNVAELDHPERVLKKFTTTYSSSSTDLIHPSDKIFFINNVCKKPGKPVNFVPVVDQDVRRWYKSDSLWFSHDERFSADQVLIIPGPEAVKGIHIIDEPIADLFGRFQQVMMSSVTTSTSKRRFQGDSYRDKYRNVRLDTVDDAIVVRLTADDVDWFSIIPSSMQKGVIAFWGQSQVLCGDKMEENILRRVCLPKEGGTLTISQNTFVCHPYPNHGSKVVLSESENGDVTIQMYDADVSDMSEPLLTQVYKPFYREGSNVYRIEEQHQSSSIMDLYHRMLFDGRIPITPLFSTATDQTQFTESELQGYLTALGERGLMPTLNFMFSLGWKPLFSVLSCSEICAGLLDLVHLSNEVQTFDAWPPQVDETLEAKARVFKLETKNGGQAVSVSVSIESDRGLCATVISEFFIRKLPNQALPKMLLSDSICKSVTIQNQEQVDLLGQLSFVSLHKTPSIGEQLTFEGSMSARHLWDNSAVFSGNGRITTTKNGLEVQVGTYTVQGTSDQTLHPLDRLFELFKLPNPSTTAVRKLIREERCWAPTNMAGYAKVSRDQNPIHQSRLFANLAKMELPIVHGMWTAGQMHSILRRSLSDDLQSRISSFKVLFDATLPLGGDLVIRVWKTGYDVGNSIVEIQAVHLTEGRELVVARAKATIQPMVTSYVFPGQGIQEQGMGMSLMKKSAAAKKIWNRADKHTRDNLGFSILRVVQQNPKTIHVGREVYRHPKGVLNLTQFTQVAMATMAQAQVAWMKEEGIFIQSAITCGHSVGEYNAISAVLEAIPLEEIVSVVWHRGLTMHTIVERDSKGRSKYKMGVIRPHYAGFTHQQAEDLVTKICEESGHFIEIVNYNVRGRQYSVTGEVEALELLQMTLEKTSIPNKKPYLEIPGIDVPFHSRLLVKGVADFRATLNEVFPDTIDPKLLIGRYIPNLTATVFRMDKTFVEEILEVVDSKPMKDILHNWEDSIQHPSRFCRTTLIELLAWQFASPVRWIETQELMFSSLKSGGLGVQEIIEVGSAKQPTLSNMAKYSLSIFPNTSPVHVFNLEAETDRLFGVDVVQTTKTEDVVADVEIVEDEVVEMVAPQAVVMTPVASSGQTLTDVSPTHEMGLQFLIARQASLRLDQIESTETIDEIFEGVSSKRNQLLLDLGSEFSVGAIDAAHEKPLSELFQVLKERSPSWNMGPYITVSIEESSKTIFGRSNMNRSEINNLLIQDFGLPAGILSISWLLLALEARDGKSIRGGHLGSLSGVPTDKKSVGSYLDQWMAIVSTTLGVNIGRASAASSGGQVDATLLNDLHDKILGKDGVLIRNMRMMAEDLGHPFDDSTPISEPYTGLEVIRGELSDDYLDRLRPMFSGEKHSPFLSVWAAAHSKASLMLHQSLSEEVDLDALEKTCIRLRSFTNIPRVNAALQYNISVLKGLNRIDLVDMFTSVLTEDGISPLPLECTRPKVRLSSNGDFSYSEEPRMSSEEFVQWVQSSMVADSETYWKESLTQLHAKQGAFEQLTVLITGASPDSIAIEIVRQLLRGNAKVIVTTTSFHAKRMAFYRSIYNEDAGPNAQLHVLPYNQASLQDADNLVEWLFESEYELQPNVILPFGAVKAYGALSDMDEMAEVSMRAMLTGVERLISNVGSKLMQAGGGQCHIVLPLSPNHGIFGGDGLYAESKAALEVLLNKCKSEQEQWSHHITMCGAIIGWVRGTGLMSGNNLVAEELENRLNIRTFSTSEMGFLISSLCDPTLIDHQDKVVKADLSGGLLGAEDLKHVVADIRSGLERRAKSKKTLTEMLGMFQKGQRKQSKISHALPFVETQSSNTLTLHPQKSLKEQVVIVGYGEIGPCGSSRTRFEMEMSNQLAPGAVVELAWITGLIRHEKNSWVDVETGEQVSDAEIAPRYRQQIMDCTGIRFIKPETVGFDTKNVETWVIGYLDKPFHFMVGSKSEAEDYCKADPKKISMALVDGEWRISLQAGAQIRLPKNVEFTRHVGGVVPDGLDFTKYGIPSDMLESVDRVTLFNLIATVDAWISAGLTPEELMTHIHPTRIGNTQSSGIGGMRSLKKLYTDPVLGAERQNDILQETLLNVMAAYVVQSYVGSYGPMSHPVGACATAALSIESGMEKILLGKADFVVTGGFDDIGIEGMYGFGDMNATAPTQDMLDKGFEPKEFSRSNDIRRGGFVEAQGGGTVLLARGDVALRLGLPVYGVLGYAGSFSDGIHRSIPAPGKGLLAMALGKEQSVLSDALSGYGLSCDDIGVVYKHDTSTTANDVNENEIHHRIQDHLERTNGNPLWVVSQKTITGHSKGGAAAWQVIGLCQALNTQRIPGNKNLACVDPTMKAYRHMCFTNQDVYFSADVPLKSGLVTSLGFGHVSAGLLVIHPDAFINAIPVDKQEAYRLQANQRKRFADYHWEDIKMGNAQAFNRVQNRRFINKDGSNKQNEEECSMLLDPSSRLIDGVFSS